MIPTAAAIRQRSDLLSSRCRHRASLALESGGAERWPQSSHNLHIVHWCLDNDWLMFELVELSWLKTKHVALIK